MKKQVAILTLGGLWNYGNRLQAVALFEALKNLGAEPVAVRNGWDLDPIPLTNHQPVKAAFEHPFQTLRKYQRKQKFVKFATQYLKRSDFLDNPRTNDLNDLATFDYVVTGSDQVWNPTIVNDQYFNYFLLEHVPAKKRISYAASISVAQVDERAAALFLSEVPKFKAASVREQAGVELLQEITETDVAVVLDPTMLLTRAEWSTLFGLDQIAVPKHKYVFTYVLGQKSSETLRMIQDFRAQGYQIVEFHNTDFHQLRKYFAKDPAEFVAFIDHAEAVITDSFHAAVFATIFHTPFTIAERADKAHQKMSSRIDTLLEMTGLQRRRMADVDSIHDVLAVDFEESDARMAERRTESVAFLRAALSD